MRPAISLVIPCHNEAPSLTGVVGAASISLESGFGPGFEIIVVDDGSTDSTQELLGRLRDSTPGLRTVVHPERLGKSAALWSGVLVAQSDWIATIDGDGQHDAADIPRLASAAQRLRLDGTQVLICGRRTRRNDRVPRRVGSWVGNHVLAWVLRQPLTDNGSGLKVFERELFLALPKFQDMHRFLPALFQRAGATVRNESITVRPRLHGRSHYTVRARAIRVALDLVGVIWLTRRWLPAPDVPRAFDSSEASDGCPAGTPNVETSHRAPPVR